MKELRTLAQATGEFPVTTPRHVDAAHSCHCVTAILIDYLEMLPEGLVDMHTTDSLLSVEPSMYNEVICSMPKEKNRIILLMLLNHWRKVAQDSSNTTNATTIAMRVSNSVHSKMFQSELLWIVRCLLTTMEKMSSLIFCLH